MDSTVVNQYAAKKHCEFGQHTIEFKDKHKKNRLSQA